MIYKLRNIKFRAQSRRRTIAGVDVGSINPAQLRHVALLRGESFLENIVVQIRDRHIRKQPRIFDVVVNAQGEILRYELQNVKGPFSIETDDVNKQIHERLADVNH